MSSRALPTNIQRIRRGRRLLVLPDGQFYRLYTIYVVSENERQGGRELR